jgi:phosphoribosylaminoimidazolecarboxamide formyltransferase / IMP cyclohydrolase
MATDIVKVARALISVSDKAGLIDLAKPLAERGVELMSTGGTAAALSNAGLAVVDIAQITGFPEMMDGRVKTLHPRVHGGLLAIRSEPAHQAAMIANDIAPIDLLIVNLYPFEATLQREASFEERIENIDIGGPAMIRGAAKNHDDVVVIVDIADYSALLDELAENDGATSLAFRRKMAQKAYARTAAYDAAISNWLAREVKESAPKWRAFGGVLHQSFGPLRYGENPHQTAALYLTAETRPGVATARQVQGKGLSYNNVNDADAAYELVAEFDPAESAAVAIIKHANPCGVALGGTLVEAYERAFACDPVSAFGGIVAMNRRLDAAAAQKIVEIFTEVIIAPEADDEALAIVASKKNLRLMIAGALPDPRARTLTVRSVAGGFLAQDRDSGMLDEAAWEVVTKRVPTAGETADLRMAWRVAKHVKSNAIVYVKDGATAGIGAGQMSRVDSARVAGRKAEDAALAAGWPEPRIRGSVVASDAFFPFADGLLSAIEAGATAVIQPGGSVRDGEVIAAADAAGLAMVFTGMRHFRH